MISLDPAGDLRTQRIHFTFEVRQPLTGGRNEKLIEVPGHLSISRAVEFFAGQPLVYRMLVFTLDIQLLRHGESHPVISLTKSGNIF